MVRTASELFADEALTLAVVGVYNVPEHQGEHHEKGYAEPPHHYELPTGQPPLGASRHQGLARL